MLTKFIECCQTPEGPNHGKFMLGRFTEQEWAARSKAMTAYPHEMAQGLIAGRGWTPAHVLILDLQTGEGAIFKPGGSPGHDLLKHAIWVCPLFLPFLIWLYDQDLNDLEALPGYVEIPWAPFNLSAPRNAGPGGVPGQTAAQQWHAEVHRCEQAFRQHKDQAG